MMWAVCPLNAQGTALRAEQARKAIWNTRRKPEKITTGVNLLRSDALIDRF